MKFLNKCSEKKYSATTAVAQAAQGNKETQNYSTK